MGTFSITAHFHRIDKLGKIPICATHIHNRISAARTLFRIEPKYWDSVKSQVRKTHVNHVEYNNKLSDFKSKYESLAINFNGSDPRRIFDIQASKFSVMDAIELKKKNIQKQGMFASERKYINLMNKILQYKINGAIAVAELSQGWVLDFRRKIQMDERITANTTVVKMVVTLKAALNEADMFGYKYNRSAFDVPKLKGTSEVRNKLNTDQIIGIIKYQSNNQHVELARDIFITQIILWGKRISDVLTLQQAHVSKDSVSKPSNKTKKSTEIRPPQLFLKILEKYIGKSKWYVFPMMTLDPKYSKTKKYFNQKSSCTALVNKRLKVIQHDLNIPFRLTTHIARHTFAHLADISGADSREIQGMLEHSSLEQTER